MGICCACTFEEWVYGGQKEPISHDMAQMVIRNPPILWDDLKNEKYYPIFEHLTSFMEQLLMYFRRHKRKETNVVKGHFATKSFRPLEVSAPRYFRPRLFLCTSHSKTGQGITMAETLIIILAEHTGNVPVNFADHFTKLVSNKLVFPDSCFPSRVQCAHLAR